jgi:hypothetical protein
MKKLLSILLLFVSYQALAGVDPKLLIRDLNKKFNKSTKQMIFIFTLLNKVF